MSQDDRFRGHMPQVWGPDNWSLGNLAPRVDLSEDETVLVVSVELAGVREEDIQLVLDRQQLMICGERKPKPGERKGNFYIMERAYGSFRRSVPLPVPVDEDGIHAHFEEGVLTVTMPKLNPGAPSGRPIPIGKG